MKKARKELCLARYYISNGHCTEFNIYYFILYLFSAINDSIFKLTMLIVSDILLKSHVICSLYKILHHSFTYLGQTKIKKLACMLNLTN